jgi:5-methylcytosine-specific restriction enzyme subunit McrC
MASSAIPIRNIYYLFLYAWDKFPEGQVIEVGGDQGPELPSLLARILLACVRTLLRRGLERDYQPLIDELAGPRGRFLITDSIKRNTFVAGRIVCAFDELTIDTQANRIIKATLKALSHAAEIDANLSSQLASMAKRFGAVKDVRLTRRLFRSLQIGRANGRYGLAMQVCRLAADLMLPDEGGGNFHFVDILEDENRMSTVFEHFVRNFYRAEQSNFTANVEHINWEAEGDEDALRFLPTMKTDITLRSRDKTIVIDAKYYKETLVTRYDGGQPKVQSAHLYQIQAYLRNMRGSGGPDETAEGAPVRLDMRVGGHRTRVWTVDLTRPWPEIHRELLDLLELQPA